MRCSVSRSDFGAPGVYLYKLTNANLFSVAITNFGGTVVQMLAKDKHGCFDDVVMGFDNPTKMNHDPAYMGKIIGRTAGRITNGKFSLNGKEYVLAKNFGDTSLHGGAVGFDSVVWTVKNYYANAESAVLELFYLAKDGESGYPANLSVHATYTVSNDDSLSLEFKATTDGDTIINLTNHAYFNLNGGSSNIEDHVVVINADHYLPSKAPDLLPTGDMECVAGTPMDFRSPHSIGERIAADFKQLHNGNGYDHCWVLKDYNPRDSKLRFAASAVDPKSGRKLEVYTTQPGLVFYTGNFLDGQEGKKGIPYHKRHAFCFETQHFPDAIYYPQWPPITLSKGQLYHHTTLFKLSIQGMSKV